MARLALHPQVSGTQQVASEYRMEEIELGPGDVVMALDRPNTLDRLEALFVTRGGAKPVARSTAG